MLYATYDCLSRFVSFFACSSSSLYLSFIRFAYLSFSFYLTRYVMLFSQDFRLDACTYYFINIELQTDAKVNKKQKKKDFGRKNCLPFRRVQFRNHHVYIHAIERERLICFFAKSFA